MLKQQLVFAGQLVLLYPIAAVFGGLAIPNVGVHPTSIGIFPVALALLLGAAIGFVLTTMSATVRATAPFVAIVPTGFVLISMMSRGAVSEDLYVVSGANEGGLGIAIVTLPTFFYVGYSVVAFAIARMRQNRDDGVYVDR